MVWVVAETQRAPKPYEYASFCPLKNSKIRYINTDSNLKDFGAPKAADPYKFNDAGCWHVSKTCQTLSI